MKSLNRFFAVALTTFLLFGCANPENARVISIGYHSDNCDECNVLKDKMKKINRKFLSEPIAFIKYDKTTASTREASEKKLADIGMLQVAQQEEGLKHVVLYDANTKEKLEVLNYDDDLATLESKINRAIQQASASK